VGKQRAEMRPPPRCRVRPRAGMAQFRATGAGPLLGRRIEVPALRVDGTKLDVELAITPYQVNGKAIFTAYVRDISERVRSEARRAAQYAIATPFSGRAPLVELGQKIFATVPRSGGWLLAASWCLVKIGNVVGVPPREWPK